MTTLTLTIGPWSLELPTDWHAVDVGISVPYMESGDQSKGCYIKAIDFVSPKSSAEDAALLLQSVHEKSSTADSRCNWAVVNRSVGQAGTLSKSVLDLFDESSQYRVWSGVYATVTHALQLTLHDYDCQDYAESVRIFDPIIASVRGVEGIH